jgi:hypothetical protein
MSLLDLASLVLAPTATKEGKVYSAIPDTGDGDMTFSRGSAATRVNSAGLIEKERANLLLQSNQFDTTWINVNSSETSGQSGYDGSNNAWLLTKTAANGRIYQSVSTSGVQTFSLYAKANDSNWISLWTNVGTSYFDLANGTKGSITASTTIDSEMVSVGNGWYRCSLIFNSSIINVRIYPADGDLDTSGSSGSIYIQDAMLNNGLVAQPYIQTTTAAVYEGITDDVPRVDYSGGGCPSLLLESQRTNLITQSEYFGAWTNDTNTILTPNAITSPSGLVDAYKLIAGTSTARQGIKLDLTPSGDVVQSVFAKKGEYSVVQITDGRNGSLYANFDLENGVLGSYQDCTPSIQEFSDGWYRCVIVYNSTLSIVNTRISIAESTTQARLVNFAGNGSDGIYIWGAMVEEGSYSTSYIPTYSVSSTRVQDYCVKTGISDLIGQTEGTIHIEFNNNQLSLYPNEYIYQIVDGSTELWIRKESGGSGFTARLIVSGSTIWTIGIIPPDGLTKIATAYKSGDSVIYMNGSVVGSVNTSTFSGSSFDTLNFFRSTLKPELLLKQAILFPTRLTNDQLEELTK